MTEPGSGSRAPSPHRGAGARRLTVFLDRLSPTSTVEPVPLQDLHTAHAPRSAEEDEQYARTLAASGEDLAPVLVHRSTMLVIDGVCRARAAVLRGHTHIPARLFDGTEEDGELLSVLVDIAHGMVPPVAVRTAAARHALRVQPDWSDRALAALTGLPGKRIAALRRESGAATAPHERRLGLDGRARPLDSAARRQLADGLLNDDPHASLRQVARAAGLSPATVADVRARRRRGEDPVPRRGAGPRPARPGLVPTPRRPVPPTAVTALRPVLASLTQDPSLRHTESGRALLRALDVSCVLADGIEGIAAHVPPHRLDAVARLAESHARLWETLASHLGQRHTGRDDRTPLPAGTGGAAG
ncbi:ParB/RepB/Spo0J family partition protein [Streptomyces sp. NPDC029216]|uniref:ParB/RepB/Spo0J family partition protein n=1 Tax=Streptomyces sp. NPDC029216 TaxID=3154701 RepID=UPI0033D452E6